MRARRKWLLTLAALPLSASGLMLSLAPGTSGATQPGASATGGGTPQPLPASAPHSAPLDIVPSATPHAVGTTNAMVSSNWSGYVDTSSTQFTGASAQWVVPTVQPSQGSTDSSTWVGVDGDENPDLIQTGTATDTFNNTATYFAWFEILPAPATPVMSVNAGDSITASVEETTTAGKWEIKISDTTQNNTFDETVSYSGPGTSAEWIEEAPTVGNGIATLSNFGTAHFSNIAETTMNSSAVTQSAIEMVDNTGKVIAVPGPFTNNAFTVTYTGPLGSQLTPTSTAASVSPTTATIGSPVTYQAQVSSNGGTPSGGTVKFSTGSTTLCSTGTLANGAASCTASDAPQGNDVVTATYSGTTTFAGSQGTTTVDVQGAHGYWLVGSDGGIFTFGSAQFHGSTGSLHLQRPVVGITVTAGRGGYWLVASDGGIFTFGDAGFFGSIPGLGIAPAGSSGSGRKLNAPIVGMVPSSDGNGYFMVASDGGVFAFGDARFEGSCPGLVGGCSGAAVAVMPDATGNGYWLVTATGHVYKFGDAANLGSPSTVPSPVTAAAATPDGQGYWILLANGTVDAFGDAANLGGPVGLTGGADPDSAIFATSDGGGYWISSASGAVFTFGDAPYDGGAGTTHLNGSIIAGAGF
jgi:hypothetical protein